MWRLVSNLSLSHLSLGGGRGTEALREILRAYLFASTREAEKQIAAIDRVGSRTVQRRVGERGWRSLCRGTEVTIALDEDQFGDSSAILFAEVLSRFLSLYAHLNSFTELVLRSTTRAEVWKRWPPMAGAKPFCRRAALRSGRRSAVRLLPGRGPAGGARAASDRRATESPWPTALPPEPASVAVGAGGDPKREAVRFAPSVRPRSPPPTSRGRAGGRGARRR